MTSNAELETPAVETEAQQVPVLLVEDDDGDALLVEELLRDVDAPVVVQRARSLGQAATLVSDAACVLLDLGLPDSQGLQGLRQLLSTDPQAAIVVLTGVASEHLGEQAVRAGAQDYLVKGEVGGPRSSSTHVTSETMVLAWPSDRARRTTTGAPTSLSSSSTIRASPSSSSTSKTGAWSRPLVMAAVSSSTLLVIGTCTVVAAVWALDTIMPAWRSA